MELLERAPFLAALANAVLEAAQGRGRLMLIGGEAGVGKSSLVRRFCEDSRTRVRVLVGACDPLATPAPLGPVTDIASELKVPVHAVSGEAPFPFFSEIAEWIASRLNTRPGTIPGRHGAYIDHSEEMADALRPLLRQMTGKQ